MLARTRGRIVAAVSHTGSTMRMISAARPAAAHFLAGQTGTSTIKAASHVSLQDPLQHQHHVGLAALGCTRLVVRGMAKGRGKGGGNKGGGGKGGRPAVISDEEFAVRHVRFGGIGAAGDAAVWRGSRHPRDGGVQQSCRWWW